MSSTQQRLWWVGAIYGLGLLVVGIHLAAVMLVRNDDWLVRSYKNRWAFRDVPSVRGALLDRHGRVLADDEPTFELECVYERFRLLHPVGAAVHGATLATRLSGTEVRYAYLGEGVGPEAAARALLSLSVGALLHADLPKEDKKELQSAAVTVLAAVAERTPARVRKQLRECAAVDPARALAAALPDLHEDQVWAQFAGILARLRALDRALAALDAPEGKADAGRVAEGADDATFGPTGEPGARPVGLLQRLDRFRVDSLEQRRTQRRLDDGSLHEGELLDRLARPMLRRVPFELAAALRVAAQDQPGLRLEPSLLRRRAQDLPPTLAQILGGVKALDQSPGPSDYVENRVEQALGVELEELVPDDLSPVPEYRQALLAEAQSSYERVLRTRERRGTGGIESMLDSALAGAPGLRLVEHDAKAKEQLLWSSLRVLPGTDVALSIDLDLQRLLDVRASLAAAHWQEVARQRGTDPGRVDVAMAFVDVHSGDVLALAGAPTELDGQMRLPAVLSWRGNGALGSIVKPFFLVEQLWAAGQGLPHADLAKLDACAGTWRGPGGHVHRCDHQHWEDGKDTVTALAKSCNVFFFQVAVGLGEEGLRRGLWRFGCLEAGAGGGDGRYQSAPPELPADMAPAARWIGNQHLPMRGIGYGLESSPLAMARAYAALATGRLPTLGLRARQARPTFDLGVSEADLAVVTRGLAECVTVGTAKKIAGLADFAVLGKTGTAEIAKGAANNAWFAGYLPAVAQQGVQLAFCAVVYAVPDQVHGADAAGLLVADVLAAMAGDAVLAQRYLQPEQPR